MSPAASPTQIRAVLDVWRRNGWVDVEGAALTAAEVIAAGSPPKAAAGAVPAMFLARNGTSRRGVENELDCLSGAAKPRSHTHSVVALTALPLEYQALSAHFTHEQLVRVVGGTRFTVSEVKGKFLNWQVALAEVGPGNLPTAIEATRAIAEFSPDLLLFVGIAGSLKPDVGVGTVVVPSRVHFYESGRADAEQFRPRPSGLATPHALEQLARSASRDWKHAAVIIKPIAAGEAVIGSERSQLATFLRDAYGDAVAVDMESAGLYEAAARHRLPALVVRGISDRLDDKKPRSDAANQPRAARAASAFAMEMLRLARPEDVGDTPR